MNALKEIEIKNNLIGKIKRIYVGFKECKIKFKKISC